MPAELHWFQNDGGPLMVVPRSPSPLWEGGEVPTLGRVVDAKSRWQSRAATDYDRACDCSGPTLLSAAEGWVLVLAGAEEAAAWMPTGPGGDAQLVFAFSRPEDASVEALTALRNAQPADVWRTLAVRVDIGQGACY